MDTGVPTSFNDVLATFREAQSADETAPQPITKETLEAYWQEAPVIITLQQRYPQQYQDILTKLPAEVTRVVEINQAIENHPSVVWLKLVSTTLLEQLATLTTSITGFRDLTQRLLAEIPPGGTPSETPDPPETIIDLAPLMTDAYINAIPSLNATPSFTAEINERLYYAIFAQAEEEGISPEAIMCFYQTGDKNEKGYLAHFATAIAIRALSERIGAIPLGNSTYTDDLVNDYLVRFSGDKPLIEHRYSLDTYPYHGKKHQEPLKDRIREKLQEFFVPEPEKETFHNELYTTLGDILFKLGEPQTTLREGILTPQQLERIRAQIEQTPIESRDEQFAKLTKIISKFEDIDRFVNSLNSDEIFVLGFVIAGLHYRRKHRIEYGGEERERMEILEKCGYWIQDLIQASDLTIDDVFDIIDKTGEILEV